MPLCLLSAALLLTSSASTHAQDLPASGETTEWLGFARRVEEGLRSGDTRYSLEMKGPGGTSAYAKVKHDGNVVGAFLPENSATSITGEVLTFNLGRALGCEDLFQPGVRITLAGDGLTAFRDGLRKDRYSGQKEQNRISILRRIDADPSALPGVFKQWGALRPVEYSSIATARAKPNGVLNQSDPIARFLKHTAPQPADRDVPVKGTKAVANEKVLARQLSNILVVDALTGQWDRYSGGNLHVFVENGRARFAALDNGGASVDGGLRYLNLFKGWVTRFDQRTIEKLAELDQFVAGQTVSFSGFQDEASLAKSLGTLTPAERSGFMRRLRAVMAHVKSLHSKSGIYFD